MNSKKRLGTSGSQLSQRLNMSKMTSQKKSTAAAKQQTRVPQSTKHSTQMNRLYGQFPQSSGTKKNNDAALKSIDH